MSQGPTGRVRRTAILVGLVFAALMLLEAVPHLRARAEALYYVSELRPGALLHATRRIQGGPFRSSVILVVTHDERGSTGLVLEGGWDDTEPGSMNLTEALGNGESIPDGRPALIAAGVPKERLGWGGPMNTGTYRLISTEPPSEDADGWRKTGEGYWVYELRSIEEAAELSSNLPTARVLVGSAGWIPGQLPHEVRSLGWTVSIPD